MRFKKIYIEILNSCNLKCSFCIQNQRPSKRMSIEEFQHILNEIKPYTKYVYLHVLGEPLLHPDLNTFLKMCEEADIYVNLTTNGTLLKSCINELQCCKLRQINISLHSYSQHHQNNYVKDLVESVSKLQEQTFISYRLWSKQNGILDEESQQLLEELLVLYDVQTPDDLHQRSSILLDKHVYLNFDEVFEWPSIHHEFVANKGSCRGFLDMCAILVDGSVIPCCLDSKGDITFGNIFTSPLSSIFESKRATTFLEEMKAKRLHEDLCQKCGYRTRFD